MNEESHNDLFGIRVNETSKKFIRKTYPFILTSIIANTLLAIIIICIAGYNLLNRDNPSVTSLWEWFLLVYPVYIIVYTIIATTGAYYYFLYIKKMRQSISDSNEEAYNLSFKYVYRNAILFTISMILALIFSVIEVLAIFLE